MVKLGFTRAYGTKLRRVIAISTSNRFKAFLAGIGVTAIMQSSTATALVLSSFAGRGLITTAAGFAVMLGADVGTTLVVQVFTFDISFLMPVLISAGVILHMMHEEGGRKRHLARIFIGLGLMLLALTLIREAAEPLRQSEVLPLILQPLQQEVVLALMFSAALTWLMHSSLATVLFYTSLVSGGVLTYDLGLVLILGANVGGAAIPAVATYKSKAAAFRIPMCNLGVRAVGVLMALPFLAQYPEWLADLTADPVRQLVMFHTLFNVALAILFLPLVDIVAKIGEHFIQDKNNHNDPGQPQYLDNDSLHTPVVALACAARETMRMADMLQDMLENTITCFAKNDQNLIREIREDEEIVDRLYKEIKIYMTHLTREQLDPKEADRYIQIISFATNLEHMGDILDKNLLELADKKIRKQEDFSKEGFAEIRAYHDRVIENMKMAQTVFLSEDPTLARKLVEEKKELRQAEIDTAAEHFKRLEKGMKESLATSSLHLDVIRDYRRINTHITAIAYAIIDNAEAHKKERKNS